MRYTLCPGPGQHGCQRVQDLREGRPRLVREAQAAGHERLRRSGAKP